MDDYDQECALKRAANAENKEAAEVEALITFITLFCDLGIIWAKSIAWMMMF